jgi:hypothetical protein
MLFFHVKNVDEKPGKTRKKKRKKEGGCLGDLQDEGSKD